MDGRGLVRVLSAMAVATALFVGASAAPASSAVAAKKLSVADCTALNGLSQEIPEVDPSGKLFDPDELEAQATGYAATAGKIKDKKLKAALGTLADITEEMSEQENATSASAVGVEKMKPFGKAIKIYTKASVQCANVGPPTSTVGSSSTSGSSTTGGSNASSSRCPLSAAQVSNALGATVVKDEPSCTYYPADDAWPNATFVRQLEFACRGTGPADLGYTETLEGLGVKAYVQRGTTIGTTILVCDARPFEIVVDIVGDDAAAFAAAQQLARLAVGS